MVAEFDYVNFRPGRVYVRRITHRGLYFACHMKGAAALPIQYAESIIALTVTRLVWPAVTLESQDKDKTNPVVPTPKHIRFTHIKSLWMDEQTCSPLCKQESHFVAPWEEVD